MAKRIAKTRATNSKSRAIGFEMRKAALSATLHPTEVKAGARITKPKGAKSARKWRTIIHFHEPTSFTRAQGRAAVMSVLLATKKR